MQVRQALQNAGDRGGVTPVKRRVGRPPKEAGAVSAPTATTALKSAPHQIFCAHSKMGPAGVTEALHAFSHTPRGILFNVRLFQEGVEIPDLNAVFFAAPRYSPRDIIQSICRPLNRLEGKPPSTVFLPTLFHPKNAVVSVSVSCRDVVSATQQIVGSPYHSVPRDGVNRAPTGVGLRNGSQRGRAMTLRLLEELVVDARQQKARSVALTPTPSVIAAGAASASPPPIVQDPLFPSSTTADCFNGAH